MINYNKYISIFLLFLLLPLSFLNADDGFPYQVKFQGIQEESISCLLTSASKLIALNDNIPLTAAALRRRAEDDVTNLLKALQSLAYYQASIDLSIDINQQPALITFTISTGPQYPFQSFQLLPAIDPLTSISTADLDITIGSSALPVTILQAEDKLKSKLEQLGYPLSKLLKREIIADESTKSISVIFHVDPGPYTTFGTTTIIGNKDVLPCFFTKKIAWLEGEQYCPKRISKTLNALEASGLFRNLTITHDEEALPDGSLPMQVTVKEAKFRSIAFGIGYATDLGGGVSAKWEHRNVRNRGEKINIETNLWQIKQEFFIRYLKPDFLIPQQDLIWKLDATRETTKGFNESSASISATIERQFGEHLRIAYGPKFTWLRNTNSNNNGAFNLLQFPMQVMWNRSNGLIDATQGYTIHMKTTPSMQTLAPRFAYTTHMLTLTAYQPMDKEHRFVLAGKASLGSIWGANKHAIPPSERLYAGSDTLLRGYHYLTVSPLNCENKPIGGRSLMVFSLETRIRLYDPFGVVFFYDIGNVYNQSCPTFDHKQLQSTGLGLRYYTPIGPIRLDVAFPLNRRHGLDNLFQVYVSIGQAF